MDGTPPDLKARDRPFDPSKTAVTVLMRRLVDEALVRLDWAENRQRRRQATAKSLHEEAVQALISDLVHRHLGEPGAWLSVELAKSALSSKTRRAYFMTEQFPILVRAMAAPEVDIIELQVGQKTAFGSFRSTIRAGSWLVRRINELGVDLSDIGRRADLLGDPLVLRGAKSGGAAKSLPVPDTDQASKLRREMVEINEWLALADLGWAGCEVTDRVDLGQRHLKRVFNDGSLGSGGRLFFGFWQGLSKQARLDNLLIGGQPVASLDFAQMSVRLAYGEVGREPPAGDLYQVYGVGGSRQGVKLVMNALLASDKIPTRLPQGTRSLFPKQVKVADVIDAIGTRHPDLVPLFGTSRWAVHQNIESRVIVAALLALKEAGVVALPVHDSLLVGRDHVPIAKQVMKDAFFKEAGVEGAVEVEGSTGSVTPWVTAQAPLKKGA